MQRSLSTAPAVFLGLGSIVGTGVFVSIALAAEITGPSVLIAIALAAFVALCNALSSAQLAAAHPVSGGTYEYGYTFLRPLAGFSAGWMFLCAKSASAASAALGFAGYFLVLIQVRGHWATVAMAAGTVIALTAIVLSGMRRTGRVNAVIVSVTLLGLTVFILSGIPKAVAGAAENYRPFFAGDGAAMPNLLHAAALMFVAYTGYGRIATLGEEVREPRKTIPKAIAITLAITAGLYLAVAAIAVGAAGREGLAATTDGQVAPLEILARGFALPAAGVVLGIAAMTAMLGVLLNLILGLSRVWLAMGRRRDMPASLGKLRGKNTTPVAAVVLVGAIVTGLTLIGDIKTTWTFSAFTVLLYYALTNLSCLALPPDKRLYPRLFAWAGLAGCAFLAFWVPWRIWTVGLGILAVGIGWHFLARRVLSARGSGA